MNVAFIPVRGGSKSIPLKNIKPICGQPLIYWTAKAACECTYIDTVFVATDSNEICNTVEAFISETDDNIFSKLKIIGRSAESASDTASTESAMLEFAQGHEFDNIILIQATSPLLTGHDLDNGFMIYNSPETDSVLSVVRQKRFNWTVDGSGIAHPSNYDFLCRPRRQNFDGYLVENGAFYITSRELLLKTKNRISGNIRVSEMDPSSYYEIDEPEDWIVIESLLNSRLKNEKTNIPKIKLFLTDCDGCLTDGGMYYSEHGDELKKFNTKDGMGFSLIKSKGIITGIITGENVELNRRRSAKLKLDIMESGCKDKLSAIKNICKEYDISIENVCYIGDDIYDVEAIRSVGFGCAPSDAAQAAKKAARYITSAKGGDGVIREVIDLILTEKRY